MDIKHVSLKCLGKAGTVELRFESEWRKRNPFQIYSEITNSFREPTFTLEWRHERRGPGQQGVPDCFVSEPLSTRER